MRKSAESKADELGYVLDAAQLRTIDQLAQLASELESALDRPGLLKRIFLKKKTAQGDVSMGWCWSWEDIFNGSFL